jgi:hypothetical protein
VGDQLAAYAAAPRTSGKATAILVLGIVGLVTSVGCGMGIIASVVALALAPGAKREIAASGGALTGGGFILAGVICAWISVALTVVFLLFFFGPSFIG